MLRLKVWTCLKWVFRATPALSWTSRRKPRCPRSKSGHVRAGAASPRALLIDKPIKNTMFTPMNFITAATGLLAGAIIGLSFGYVQEAAWRRHQRLQQEGKFNNGWAVM